MLLIKGVIMFMINGILDPLLYPPPPSSKKGLKKKLKYMKKVFEFETLKTFPY